MITELNSSLQIKQSQAHLSIRIIDDDKDRTMTSGVMLDELFESLDFSVLVAEYQTEIELLGKRIVLLGQETTQFQRYDKENNSPFHSDGIADNERMMNLCGERVAKAIQRRDAAKAMLEAFKEE